MTYTHSYSVEHSCLFSLNLWLLQPAIGKNTIMNLSQEDTAPLPVAAVAVDHESQKNPDLDTETCGSSRSPDSS